MKSKSNPKIIHNTILQKKTAPWTINQPIVKLELTKLSKTKTHYHFSKEIFRHPKRLSKSPPHRSRQGMKVGCTTISQNQEQLKHLPNESSIYSTGVTPIDLAMNIIANHKSKLYQPAGAVEYDLCREVFVFTWGYQLVVGDDQNCLRTGSWWLSSLWPGNQIGQVTCNTQFWPLLSKTGSWRSLIWLINRLCQPFSRFLQKSELEW